MDLDTEGGCRDQTAGISRTDESEKGGREGKGGQKRMAEEQAGEKE